MSHAKAIVIVISIIQIFVVSPASASDEYAGGIWTKTTHPDAQNVSIFYVDNRAVKAVGYGHIAGKPAIWYAEGTVREGHLTLRYRYSPNATPDGWEPEGKMQLEVSEDGTSMSGTAGSLSGDWSGPVEFRRIHLGPG